MGTVQVPGHSTSVQRLAEVGHRRFLEDAEHNLVQNVTSYGLDSWSNFEIGWGLLFHIFVMFGSVGHTDTK